MHDVLDAARTKAERIDATNNQTLAAGTADVQQELQRGQSINLSAGLMEFDRNPQLSATAGQASACKTSYNSLSSRRHDDALTFHVVTEGPGQFRVVCQ